LVRGIIAKISYKRELGTLDLQNVILPVIAEDANKYSRGALAVFAGSARYPGAAVLTSLAAARSGAGYVTLFTPQDAVASAQAHLVAVPVVGLASDRGAFAGELSADDFAATAMASGRLNAGAVAIGPGITNTPSSQKFLLSLLSALGELEQRKPVLLDADGLNALAELAKQGELAGLGEPAARSSAAALRALEGAVLTPHAKELERLLDAFAVDCASELAQLLGVVVVSKGPLTTVTDGLYQVELDAGTPALATAGTGDVLSGIISALLAQTVVAPMLNGAAPLDGATHLDGATTFAEAGADRLLEQGNAATDAQRATQIFDTAVAGVTIHGAAGRVAEARLGRRSVTALDVIDALPAVFKEIDEGAQL
jgi:hydroxyethylthiazole kinase-like uncharacterized protein yjeF